MFSRIPLAWLNLSYRPVRFAVFLAGIGFAVVLMFVELGFWGALLDSFTTVVWRMNAELTIINSAKPTLIYSEPFPRSWLIAARAVPGVVGTTPLYIRSGSWMRPSEGGPDEPSQLMIRVIAYDLNSNAMRFPEVEPHLDQLRLPATALADRKSKAIYQLKSPPVQAELNSQQIDVVGQFTLGTDFANDASLLMSEQNFAHYFGNPSSSESTLEDVDVGLVFLAQGADVEEVRQAIEAALPPEVKVQTRAQLAAQERGYWQNNMPIGFVFLLGLVVGFLVGVVICSQILASDVADHLPEYATLKAIGYSNVYLSRVIVTEAVLLAVLTFIPGTTVSMIIYSVLEDMTGLPLRMSLSRASAVLGFTVLMCVLSGCLAARKVWTADPAEVFG